MRLDTHVYAGYTVPPYYDSLLAKVIVHGNDREEALSRMGQALDSFILEGVTTTIPFLARVIRHPDFVAGERRHEVPRAGIASAASRRMRIDVVFTPPGLTSAERAGPNGVRHRHPARHHLHVRGAESRGQGHHPGGLDRGGAAPGADDRQRGRAARRREEAASGSPAFTSATARWR